MALDGEFWYYPEPVSTVYYSDNKVSLGRERKEKKRKEKAITIALASSLTISPATARDGSQIDNADPDWKIKYTVVGDQG